MSANRKEPFVPLTSTIVAPNDRSNFRLTIVPQAANARPFASAGQPAVAFPAPSGTAPEPQVTLQRDGDSISVIRVQCGCGQSIELACVYDPAAQNPSVPAPATPSLPPVLKPVSPPEAKRETKRAAR